MHLTSLKVAFDSQLLIGHFLRVYSLEKPPLFALSSLLLPYKPQTDFLRSRWTQHFGCGYRTPQKHISVLSGSIFQNCVIFQTTLPSVTERANEIKPPFGSWPKSLFLQQPPPSALFLTINSLYQLRLQLAQRLFNNGHTARGSNLLDVEWLKSAVPDGLRQPGVLWTYDCRTSVRLNPASTCGAPWRRADPLIAAIFATPRRGRTWGRAGIISSACSHRP